MLNFRSSREERRQRIAGRAALTYYRSSEPSGKSPFRRKVRSKKRRFLSRAIDWLVVLIILAAVIYSLIVRPQPEIIASSNDYHSSEVYQDSAAEVLKKIENRNKLTFDEQDLAYQLKREFPEIAAVRADLPLFGQKPTLYLEIAKPALVLRGAEGTYGAVSRLIIDTKGTVIGPQAEFPGIQNLALVADNTGFTARSGETVLSPSDIGFILTVIAQAERAGAPIASLALPKLAEELDLKTSDRKYFVKFYLGGDALTQSGQFLAARKQFDKTNKQPGQYLDVRVAGKVFYK